MKKPKPFFINTSVHSKDSVFMNLFEAVSSLFEKKALTKFPLGVEEVEMVTPESVRVKFFDEVDEDLLARIADEEGYVVAFFSPREQWNYINAIDKKDKKRIFAEAIPLDEFPVKIIH